VSIRYIDQDRLSDAETELRTAAATDAENSEAELDLIRFLYTFKKGAAARQELLTRIQAGENSFPYQMALAEFDLSLCDEVEYGSAD
jgi:thioredoxin-like negative regulator of GroEL